MSDGLRKCMSGILISRLGAQRTGPVLGGPASAPANQQIWHAAWVFPPGSLEMVCLPNICFQKRVESRRKKHLLIRKQFHFVRKRDLFWYAQFPKADSDPFPQHANSSDMAVLTPQGGFVPQCSQKNQVDLVFRLRCLLGCTVAHLLL